MGKKIRFIEDRRLLDNTIVRVGDEMEFEDAEADGFVTNGVAEHVTAAKSKTTKEVSDNG